MTQVPTPQFYLSLLSGRPGGMSHISTDPHHSDIASRISDHPFRNDSNRLMDLLDAFASICVRKEKEVFCVSLAMDPGSATLYVASNDTVTHKVLVHLRLIRGHLKALSTVSEFDAQTPTDSETSPNPNNTGSAAFIAAELELKKTIYDYSYRKLRQRFLKRAPLILEKLPAIEIEFRGIDPEDQKLLSNTIPVLKWLKNLLQNEKLPNAMDLVSLIKVVDALNKAWQGHLDGTVSEDRRILTYWDSLIYGLYPKQSRILSMQRLLVKLFTLHNHICTITRVAWSKRLSPILDGNFTVISVPAGHDNISSKFSEQNIFPIIFPPEKSTSMAIKKTVYNELLQQLKKKANDEEVVLKKETAQSALQLSIMNVKIHAECTLLAYHLQHPNTKPYNYIGGSKVSCHGCTTFFNSFNLVAESFNHPLFFTKGCHHKIYLRWPCPSLLSQEQQIQLRGKEPNLDTQVRKGMAAALHTELAAYVNELVASAELSIPTPSDSTNASGDSSQRGMFDLEKICTLLNLELHNLPGSGKFRCLLCPVSKPRLFVYNGVVDHLQAKHKISAAQDGVHYMPS